MDNANPKRVGEGLKQLQVALVAALLAIGYQKLLDGLGSYLPFIYAWETFILAFGLVLIAYVFWAKWQKGWVGHLTEVTMEMNPTRSYQSPSHQE